MAANTKNTQKMEVASAVNLFAHPVAGAAAWSAFGMGLASQAFGMWMGALAGAAEASQHLFDTEKKAGPQPKLAVEGPAGRRALSSDEQAPATAGPIAAQAFAVAEAVGSEAVVAGGVEAPRSAPVNDLADDLKAIAGVGPKLEQVLNGLGIRSYEQIAAWSEAEIAAIEETLGLGGRIVRDGWIGQAVALAEAKAKH